MTERSDPADLLRLYGLRPELTALAAEHGATLGRVRTVYGIAWEVVTAERVLRASFDVRSRARREEDHRLRPAVGDWVLLSRDEATIERVLPRASLLSRKAAGKGDVAQVIAANVDVLAVVTSLDADLSERRIERYVLMAREGGVRPAVVCSKSDACVGEAREAMLARLATVCATSGARQGTPGNATARGAAATPRRRPGRATDAPREGLRAHRRPARGCPCDAPREGLPRTSQSTQHSSGERLSREATGR